MFVETFNEITEHFSLRLAAARKQSSSAECREVVETSAGANEIVRAKLPEMKKEIRLNCQGTRHVRALPRVGAQTFT
jgi:hypothetical protein